MGDHPFRFSVAIFAFAVLAIPSFAANRPAANDPAPPQAAAQQQNSQKKVWTNADLDQLRNRDAISIVGVGPDDDFSPPEPTPAQQGAKQRVWTNEDLEKLRNPDVLSIVPAAESAPAPNAPSAVPPAAEAALPEAVPYDRFRDPAWYAEMAHRLYVELDLREYELLQGEEALAAARGGATQPGVNLYLGNLGITPEAGIQNLEEAVREVKIQLDALTDLARRNGMPPGVVRG